MTTNETRTLLFMVNCFLFSPQVVVYGNNLWFPTKIHSMRCKFTYFLWLEFFRKFFSVWVTNRAIVMLHFIKGRHWNFGTFVAGISHIFRILTLTKAIVCNLFFFLTLCQCFANNAVRTRLFLILSLTSITDVRVSGELTQFRFLVVLIIHSQFSLATVTHSFTYMQHDEFMFISSSDQSPFGGFWWLSHADGYLVPTQLYFNPVYRCTNTQFEVPQVLNESTFGITLHINNIPSADFVSSLNECSSTCDEKWLK